MSKLKDKTGQKFGRLKVVEYLGKIRTNKRHYWKCICDCGNTSIVQSGELNQKTKGAKSCGCLRVEKVVERSTTHGQTDSISYMSYRAAKERCNNPNHKDYKNYGGRGIQFLFRDFTELVSEIGERPDKKYSLDRIDVNGNYEPKNVKWSTTKEQNNNTRVNRYLTLHGITKTLSEWTGGKLSPEYSKVKQRLYSGFCEECALTTNFCEHRV
jgi:hypothetical protein